MHAKAHSADASDSMKMFRMGLEGGKPAAGQVGVQPEWFYKGDGRSIVAPESPLLSPEFAADAGEEPELAASTSSALMAHLAGWVLRSPTNSPITSWSGPTTCTWPTRSCGVHRSVPSCWWATCRGHPRHGAHHPRRTADLGETLPHG